MDISVFPCRVTRILSKCDVDDSHQNILDISYFQRYCATVECRLLRAVNVRFIGYMALNGLHNFLECDVRLSPKAALQFPGILICNKT